LGDGKMVGEGKGPFFKKRRKGRTKNISGGVVTQQKEDEGPNGSGE